MLKRNFSILTVLATAGLLAGCVETGDEEVKTVGCNGGTFLGVIQDSIFDPIMDGTETRKQERCFETEYCVLVYGSKDKYACSEFVNNYHIRCNGEKVDASQSNEHCGSCRNVCQGGKVCKQGECVVDDQLCTKDDVKCAADGKTLLKCDDQGQWQDDHVCGSGVCSDKACADKVCDANAKQCAADGKTPQVCENNAWKDLTSCDNACEAGECVKKTPDCQPNENKCAADGKTLLKCDDQGQWQDDHVCESGVCSDKACADKVCDANAKQCAADGKTPQVCENNAWKDLTSCADACEAGECLNFACHGDEVKCADDKNLLVCKNGDWEQKSCAYACLDDICFDEVPLDTDADTVPDYKDVCPYNADYTTEKPNSCVNFTNGTLNIYFAQDLYDAAMILSGNGDQNENYQNIKPEQIKVIDFKSDINLADLANMSSDDDECVVNDWNFGLQLNDVVIKGNGHRITSVTTDGARCALPQPLFDTLHQTEISDLSIDFDVKDGQGLLANRVFSGDEDETLDSIKDTKSSVIRNVTYAGLLISTAESNVGGLVGEVVAYVVDTKQSLFILPTLIEDCYADGVTVSAPNSDNVGGLVGKTWGAKYSYTKDQIMKIDSVSGKDNVGGVLGVDARFYDEFDTQNGYLRVAFDTVQGNSRVGGYVGQGHIVNVVMVGNAVLAKAGTVGGMVGICSYSGSSNGADCNAENSALQIDSVESKGDSVGGMVGVISSSSTSLAKHLYVRSNKVYGNDYVGGAFGKSSPQKISFSELYVRADHVEGANHVGGLTGFIGSNSGSVKQYSVLANLFAPSGAKMGGVASQVSTPPSSVSPFEQSWVATTRYNNAPSCSRVWAYAMSETNKNVVVSTSALFYQAEDYEYAFNQEDNGNATPVKPASVQASSSNPVENFKFATNCIGGTKDISFYVYPLPDLSEELDKLVEAVKSDVE